MPVRAVSILLAFLLLWSGLNTAEVPEDFARGSPVARHPAPAGAEALRAALHDGSVAHHHLDDLPTYPRADPAAEPVVLLTRAPTVVPTVVAGCWAGAGSESVMESPFLAGLLRPPCTFGVPA